VPDLIPVKEAARLANVARPTVYRAIARGELPAIRVGELAGPLRVDREAFLAWLYGPDEAA
jgi:excisionase family DNA binding protein